METQSVPWSARQAQRCYRQAASPTAFGERARQWDAAGRHFDAAARAESAGDWARADLEWKRATEILRSAGLSLDGDTPDRTDGSSMIGLCGMRAKALRAEAERASELQTERAVVQYGAAAALDRAAALWADGRDTEARSWMRAARHVLEFTLAPVPWQQTRPV